MTLPISVDPALLGVQAASESAGAASMAGAAAAAAPVTTAVLPPGSDLVSVAAAGGLNAHGAVAAGAMAEFIAMREMFAGNVSVSGASYAATEALNKSAVIL
jgi:hypothetical protein